MPMTFTIFSIPQPRRRCRRVRRPRTNRRTLSRTRADRSGTAISGVLPTWGLMKQLGRVQSGWPSGSGSGSVTSRPAPSSDPLRSAATRSSVTTWRPRATLTSQVCADSSPSRRASKSPSVSGVRARASTTTSEPGRTSSSSADGHRAIDTGERFRRPTHDGDRRTEGFQQSHERTGDPAAADHGDRGAEEVAALGRRPGLGVGVGGHSPQAHQREGERLLGDGVGVHALAGRPRPLVVEDGDVRLDPGPRELHPGQLGAIVEQGPEAGGVSGVGPHHRIGGAVCHGRPRRRPRRPRRAIAVRAGPGSSSPTHPAGSVRRWRPVGDGVGQQRHCGPGSSVEQ